MAFKFIPDEQINIRIFIFASAFGESSLDAVVRARLNSHEFQKVRGSAYEPSIAAEKH